MKPPVVSVIIPVLNTKPYLAQCLDSLLAQTLCDIEIICIDNGSSDGSFQTLQDYAHSHQNIVVSQHLGGRQGAARNAGIALARGAYLGFVDSDDFVAPSMFERMHQKAVASKADMVVCNATQYYDQRGKTALVMPVDVVGGQVTFNILERPKLLRNLTPWNKLFAQRFMDHQNLRFQEGVFHEDVEFTARAFLTANRIACVADPLYFYRKQRSGSVNLHRGADHLVIFGIMQRLLGMADAGQLSKGHDLLLQELTITKLINLIDSVRGRYRREYFRKMRRMFSELSKPRATQLLTPTECHEFEVIRRVGYCSYQLFRNLRCAYGFFITLPLLRGTVRKVRHLLSQRSLP